MVLLDSVAFGGKVASSSLQDQSILVCKVENCLGSLPKCGVGGQVGQRGGGGVGGGGGGEDEPGGRERQANSQRKINNYLYREEDPMHGKEAVQRCSGAAVNGQCAAPRPIAITIQWYRVSHIKHQATSDNRQQAKSNSFSGWPFSRTIWAAAMVDVKAAGLLLFCTAGIYGAYLTQGLVSEHLQLKRFGASQERFGNLEALNGAQSFVCFVWAYAIVLLQRHAIGSAKAAAAEAKELPSWWEYWRPALTNSIGPAFGMVALKNISYPVRASRWRLTDRVRAAQLCCGR